MKKKKGFTLVELLAVIVILAVILIIAVPRITDVIKNAKKSSMEDASKLIATQAEKQWLINQTLSPSDPGYVDLNSSDACSKVSKYNSSDYESCSLRVNDNGQITSFSMTGKGKFAGLKCTGTSSSNITCSESDTNSPEYLYAFRELEKSLIYEIGEGCMEYAQRFSNGKNLSEPEATKYCNKEESTKFDSKTGTYSTVSIQQDINNGSVDYLITNNVIVPEYDIGEGCMDFARSGGLSEAEATKYCNKEEAHITVSIQKDIDMGAADWLIDNNVITNVVKDGDTITSWEVGEDCMDSVKGLLSEVEGAKYCNKEEAYETLSIQLGIDRGDADYFIDNNVITNVVKDGDTITSWEVGEGCTDFARSGGLSEAEATKLCNKEEVIDSNTIVSIQRDIVANNYNYNYFEENNVIKLKYEYNSGEEDYTKVKDEYNTPVQVFMRYGTQDDSKAVCTLYGGNIHCFEATSSAYQSNSSTLQALFGSNKCDTSITNQISCTDSNWTCTVSADGSASCVDPSYVGCAVDNYSLVNCYRGENAEE